MQKFFAAPNFEYIALRSKITHDESGGGLFASSGGIGFHVVTPLVLDDRPGGVRVLVNRGWVPKGRIDPRTRPQGQVEGKVKLVGVVRCTEQRPQFQPKDQGKGRTILYRC